MMSDALSALENIKSESLIDLLCFDVGNERFAVELWSVDEVVDAAVLDSYATSGSLAGVLRLHNELVPVHDAECVLRVKRVAANPMALVFSRGESAIAMLVDDAETVLAVNLDGLRSPGAITCHDGVLTGALRVRKRWVGLLHAAALVEALASAGLTEAAHAN